MNNCVIKNVLVPCEVIEIILKYILRKYSYSNVQWASMKNCHPKKITKIVIMSRALWSENLIWNLELSFISHVILDKLPKNPASLWMQGLLKMNNEQCTIGKYTKGKNPKFIRKYKETYCGLSKKRIPAIFEDSLEYSHQVLKKDNFLKNCIFSNCIKQQ